MRSLLTVTHNSLLFMNTTYVFDGNQPNGGGLDSNLAAALLSQGRNNGFGGNDGLWGSSTSQSSHPSSDGTEAASEDSAASEAEAQSPPSSRVTRDASC